MPQLSKKSWHYKLHELTYGEWKCVPNNLCPYFWKLVIAAIFFIPLSIYYLPAIIFISLFNLIKKDPYDKIEPIKDEGYFSINLLMTALGYDAAILGFYMIDMWFVKWFYINNKGVKDMHVVVILGLVGWLITIGFLIYRIVIIRQERKQNEQEKDEPSIVIEVIKAWYNKNCPRITWKD